MGSKIRFQPMPPASQFTCMPLKLFIATAVDVCKPFKGEVMQEWFDFERSITDYTDLSLFLSPFTFFLSSLLSDVCPVSHSARLQLAQISDLLRWSCIRMMACDLKIKWILMDAWYDSLFQSLSLGLGIPLQWWDDDNGLQLCIIRV